MLQQQTPTLITSNPTQVSIKAAANFSYNHLKDKRVLLSLSWSLHDNSHFDEQIKAATFPLLISTFDETTC